MTVTIRTGVPEVRQMTEFGNATLQGTPDDALAFSIATHITGLAGRTEDTLARELDRILTVMAAAAHDLGALVDFEVEIGAAN